MDGAAGRRIEDRLAAAGLPALPRLAWLEIDLDALVANLGELRALAGAGVAVQPVVKADAYGHGAVAVARALESAGADGLCVATYDEAAELRRGGVRLPIRVLYPVPSAWVAEAARGGIALTVGDAAGLEATLAAAAAARPGRARRALRLHLEVETGLGRGGVGVDAVRSAVDRIRGAPGVRLAGIWTHLQEPGDAVRTARQVERFEAAVARLDPVVRDRPTRHLAASGGLLLGNVLSYEGVRPGLATYGLVPDELLGGTGAADLRPLRLRPILSLHARPVRVADLPPGWGISYGPTFVTARPSRIATLPLGYADGWPRSLSNRAEALVRGQRVPLVGNVAMDAVMADVTDVPGPPVTTDDEFILLGAQGAEEITVADVARLRATIGREVMTAMSRRLPRVYHAAAGLVGERTLVQPAFDDPRSTIGRIADQRSATNVPSASAPRTAARPGRRT